MIKKKNIFYFFFILLIFLVDRISKVLIIRLSNTTENQEIIVSKFLSLNLIWNKGIAFGIFSFDEKFFYNILTMIIIIVTLVVFWLMVKAENLEKYGFMIIFSGSLGNVYDRLVYSSVPDFIDFHFENFHWFTFNVADIFITTGVVLLILNEFNFKKKI
jgi:signal peptidase II